MSRDIDTRRREIIDAHPEWRKRPGESEGDYARRMMAIAVRLSGGRFAVPTQIIDAEYEAVSEEEDIPW